MFATRVHVGNWPSQGTTAVRASGLARLGLRWVRQALCALRGHDMVLVFEPDRLSLGCLACGARTKGWTIDVNPAYRRRGRRCGPQSSGTSLKAA